MRLPDFLIIGAMKAGTTTLYRDLRANPAIFCAKEKERSDLLRDEVLTPAGTRAYARRFRGAASHQVCGIAPTRYTNLPDCPGVPERARRVHGADLKAIYLVREPVARAVSQHYHDLCAGTVSLPLDEALRREPRFVNYSRYAMQVSPWIDVFGPERVMIIRFEDYVADRRGTVAEVCRFLGVEPRGDLIRADVAYNRGDAKPLPRGVGGALVRNRLYRGLVRPFLSPGARDRLGRALLPKAPPRPAPPSAETVDFVLDALRDDLRRLEEIMGLAGPPWDLDEVRRRHAAASAAGGGP